MFKSIQIIPFFYISTQQQSNGVFSRVLLQHLSTVLAQLHNAIAPFLQGSMKVPPLPETNIAPENGWLEY